MKHSLIFMSLIVLVSCSNRQNSETRETVPEIHTTHGTSSLQLNNGKKWKADISTKNNVDSIMKVLNDSRLSGGENKGLLKPALQEKIDTLVKQCRMKGPDHDALHVWLNNVLADLKGIEEEPDEYDEALAKLKDDVESFYQFFE